jgi:hypothetical protein
MVKMERCLRSRSASAARGENAASVTSGTEALESISDNELQRNVTNVETYPKRCRIIQQ